MSFNSDIVFTSLLDNLHILHEQLGRNDIMIYKVSGADFFYTDGSAVGASYKISPFSFYYTATGAPHFGCAGEDYDLYGKIINDWLQTVISSKAVF